MNCWLKKYGILSGLTALLFFFYAGPVQAAPQAIITWQAQTYQPSEYSGKNLPTANAPVIAAVELVNNGKIIDISKSNIGWFQNRRLIDAGVGLKRVLFSADGTDDGVLIEVNIEYQDGVLTEFARIPLISPKVVINAPYPQRLIGTGLNIFQALPYFFNIKGLNELEFTWSLNGETAANPEDKTDVLKLNLNLEPTEAEIILTAAATLLQDFTQSAQTMIKLIARK